MTKSLVLAAMFVSAIHAQQGNPKYLHHSAMPPGMVGQQQLMRSPALPGYVQPVEVSAPESVRIAAQVDGVYMESVPSPLLVGMQIGHVYQLKVTNIPFHEGAELYPTVELVN